MFIGKIADQLAEAGHEVVLYQPILNQEVENLVGCKNCRPIERKPDRALPSLPDVRRTLLKLIYNLVELYGLGKIEYVKSRHGKYVSIFSF
jgi:hypothetical protein